MRNYYQTITIACCMAMSASPLAIWAQSGDEQGLEIPRNLQLQQDKDELRKAYDGWWTASQKNKEQRMSWYNEAKFGCFIHWGPYSVPAGLWKNKMQSGYTEHLMRKARIPLEEYKKELILPFNPTEFGKANIVGISIGWIHGESVVMLGSNDEISHACFRCMAHPLLGIKFGFYYSHAFDWEHPDAPGNDWDYPTNPGGDKLVGGKNWWLERKDFLANAEKYVNEKSIPQIQELIRKYDPDILWFDTPQKLPLYLNIRILEAIRQADPQNKIVVNGRLARFGSNNIGDYRNTGDRSAFFFPTEGAWESIPTTNESYGYSVVDTVRKPVSFFVQLLPSATSKGGNILMNVGPMGNGRWDKRDIEVFQGIGQWLKVNGESIYGAQRTNLPIQPWGVTTLKGDTLYAHVFHWPADGKLIIGGLRSDIGKGWLVADKKAAIRFKRLNADDYELTLPAYAPDSMNSVIALVLNNRKFHFIH